MYFFGCRDLEVLLLMHFYLFCCREANGYCKEHDKFDVQKGDPAFGHPSHHCTQQGQYYSQDLSSETSSAAREWPCNVSDVDLGAECAGGQIGKAGIASQKYSTPGQLKLDDASIDQAVGLHSNHIRGEIDDTFTATAGVLSNDIISKCLSSNSLSFHSLKNVDGHVYDTGNKYSDVQNKDYEGQKDVHDNAVATSESQYKVVISQEATGNWISNEVDADFKPLVADNSLSSSAVWLNNIAGADCQPPGESLENNVPVDSTLPTLHSKANILEKFLSDVYEKQNHLKNGEMQHLTKWQSSPHLSSMVSNCQILLEDTSEPLVPLQRSYSMQFINDSTAVHSKVTVADTVSSLQSSDDVEFCRGLEKLDAHIAKLQDSLRHHSSNSLIHTIESSH